MFRLSNSRSIGASLNKLNFAKIRWVQTQYFSFPIVIVTMRNNDYGNICNNGIPALSILHLLASWTMSSIYTSTPLLWSVL